MVWARSSWACSRPRRRRPHPSAPTGRAPRRAAQATRSRRRRRPRRPRRRPRLPALRARGRASRGRRAAARPPHRRHAGPAGGPTRSRRRPVGPLLLPLGRGDQGRAAEDRRRSRTTTPDGHRGKRRGLRGVSPAASAGASRSPTYVLLRRRARAHRHLPQGPREARPLRLRGAGRGPGTRHAFMVMDDDYAETATTTRGALKVTAAHEYNHVSSSPTTCCRTSGCSSPPRPGWRRRSTPRSTTTTSTSARGRS